MEKRFYEVKFTESAEKDLKKLIKSNKAIAKLIKKWISDNLTKDSKKSLASTSGR